MNRLFYLLLFCIVSISNLFAQEVVTGIVVDSHDEPVPGVRIEVVGRTETAMTDVDGTFRIELPAEARKLRVSYVGVKPFDVKIKPSMIIKLGKGWASKSSGYRGFWELTGGVGFGGKVNVRAGNNFVDDISNSITFGWVTSHGYQINRNLYVGLGFGFMGQMLTGKRNDYWVDEHTYRADHEEYGINVPVFVDVRWDFGLAEKTAPYVGLKLGYQYLVAFDDGSVFDGYEYSDGYYGNSLEVYGESVGGLLFQPSVGMRTRLRNKVGMNFGISYNVSLRKKLRAEYHFDSPENYGVEQMDLGTSSGGALMLNIGFDF